jgi:high frequency lysogenization protein
MSPIEAQACALAGVFQAVRLVLSCARDGRCDDAPYEASLASVYRIDADNAEAVFGGRQNLTLGLTTLVDTIEGRGNDTLTMRLAVAVIHLEGKLRKHPAKLAQIQQGIARSQRSATALGVLGDGVADQLGEIYLETLSSIRPRIIVPGNGLHLSQARVVARIRALLLAAVRAAVLWRQVGGSQWSVLFRRRRLCDAAKALLATPATS